MDPKYFVGLFMSQYLIDRTTTTPCKSLTGEFLLFFHHVFSAYIYFGPFFFNPLYHFITSIGVFIHWKTYKQCILTVYTNKLCGNDKKKRFNDFVKQLGISQHDRQLNQYYLMMLMIYDLYLIYH